MDNYISKWSTASDAVKSQITIDIAQKIRTGVDLPKFRSLLGVELVDQVQRGVLSNDQLKTAIENTIPKITLSAGNKSLIDNVIDYSDEGAFSLLLSVYSTSGLETVAVIQYMNESLDIPAGFVDYGKLLKKDPADGIKDIENLENFKGDISQIETYIYSANIASKEKLKEKLKAVSAKKAASGAVITVDEPDETDMNNWLTTVDINTVSLTTATVVGFPERIDIDDTGVRALYLAVLFVSPGILNSLLFKNVYVSNTSGEEAVSGKTIFRVKNEFKDLLDRGQGGPVLLNSLSTLFVLVAHKLLGYYKDDLFSSHDHEDSRLFTLDMVLNAIGIGIYINGQVVGDESNMMTETIKIDDVTQTITVNKPTFYGIFRDSSNDVFVEEKVCAARFLYYYDDLGYLDSSRDMNSADFWESVWKQDIQANEFGNRKIVNLAKYI